MVLAETPEKNATEKLAPVTADNLPIRMRGRARTASLCVQLRLSIKLAIKRPRVIKKVILTIGRMTCGHIAVMRSCSIVWSAYRGDFCCEFINGRYYTAEAGKKIIIMKRIFWLVYRQERLKTARVVGFAREKTVDFLRCCCFIVTEFQVL
jgi:hypothetical protein